MYFYLAFIVLFNYFLKFDSPQQPDSFIAWKREAWTFIKASFLCSNDKRKSKGFGKILYWENDERIAIFKSTTHQQLITGFLAMALVCRRAHFLIHKYSIETVLYASTTPPYNSVNLLGNNGHCERLLLHTNELNQNWNILHMQWRSGGKSSKPHTEESLVRRRRHNLTSHTSLPLLQHFSQRLWALAACRSLRPQQCLGP